VPASRFRAALLPVLVLFLIAAPGVAPAGAQSSDELTALNTQIADLNGAGKYGEAVPLAERALALAERLHGPQNPVVAAALNTLAGLYVAQGRAGEAEPLYERTIATLEAVRGPDHPDVAIALNNLAGLYRNQGRYADAERLYKRTLSIFEKARGADNVSTGVTLNNLAALYHSQGRYGEAEPLYKRTIAIFEKALGRNHPDVGTVLNNLAGLYRSQGRYAEAEPLLKRALALREKALGPDHPDVATSLNNLAALYQSQERAAEAESLYRRALAIREQALGPDHPDVSAPLNNLALLYKSQGRLSDAEPLLKRALALREKALGPEHPDVGQSLNNLAELYRAQGRYAEAEPLYRRDLAISEKALGPEHPEVATSLNNLAEFYRVQGRYAEAEPLYKRAIAVFEKAQGPDHPDVGTALNNLAGLYFAQQQWAEAARYWQQSIAVVVRRTRRGIASVGAQLVGKGRSEAEREIARFWGFTKAAYRLAAADAERASELAADAFLAAQWAQASEAAASLTQMAARQAKGSGALAALVRERQDLVGEWQVRDKLLIAAVSQQPDKRNAAVEQEQRTRLAAIDARLADIDRRLAKDFPDYTALASPEPLTLREVQELLHAGEVLVLTFDTPLWLPLPEETFLWVITKTQARWVRSELGAGALSERVAALRCGLDHTQWYGEARACLNLVKAEPSDQDSDGRRLRVLPFDLARAHELYKALLGPAEDLINGAHLLVVPSGPLTSLPFNVLVSELRPVSAPDAQEGGAVAPNIPRTLAEYREVAWLGARQPISVLPSAASLKALRAYAKPHRAGKPYLGIGNPLLEGEPYDPQWGPYWKKQAQAARAKSCSRQPAGKHLLASAPQRAPRGFEGLFRGGHADIDRLRAWSPLPETADELCEVGARIGAKQRDVLLGARATETALKDLSDKGELADYGIVHFATHGALSGQVRGAAEPGLVLTPPPKGTTDPKKLERDDGFLTASEIATLKLDADWVILSACNTAAGARKGENAEALSGLAQAFFYAGARALLVSHWEVGSQAAVKLTTRAFAELKADPKIGRAEAFRRSMRELIANGVLYEAHPEQWAPFVLVGEGANR
jgi:tetratricopeptide (TPR) repeat protein